MFCSVYFFPPSFISDKILFSHSTKDEFVPKVGSWWQDGKDGVAQTLTNRAHVLARADVILLEVSGKKTLTNRNPKRSHLTSIDKGKVKLY